MNNINLLNSNGTTQSAKDVENTTWHEIAHANDSTNKNTQDREIFANSVGSAGSGMASVNNFFYGNGGLTDSSIATNYNTNKTSTIAQNNQVAGILTLTGQREDKAFIATRALGNYNPNKESILSVLHHGFNTIINPNKQYLEKVIAESELNPNEVKINETIDKNGVKQYFVVISGGPENEGGIDTMVFFPGNLVIDTSGTKGFNKTDIQYAENYITNGNTELMKPYNNITQDNEFETDVKVLNSAKEIHEQKNEYFIVPGVVNFFIPGIMQIINPYIGTKNSNSTSTSICLSAGASNCNNLPWIRPGSSVPIKIGK